MDKQLAECLEKIVRKGMPTISNAKFVPRKDGWQVDLSDCPIQTRDEIVSKLDMVLVGTGYKISNRNSCRIVVHRKMPMKGISNR